MPGGDVGNQVLAKGQPLAVQFATAAAFILLKRIDNRGLQHSRFCRHLPGEFVRGGDANAVKANKVFKQIFKGGKLGLARLDASVLGDFADAHGGDLFSLAKKPKLQVVGDDQVVQRVGVAFELRAKRFVVQVFSDVFGLGITERNAAAPQQKVRRTAFNLLRLVGNLHIRRGFHQQRP
ncbi:MAG: hypothetical protein MPK13_03830 [Gammaproteobacteria bacterium]|nr:hypothetical protein [Gammaproteobacteria bacterium]